MIDDFIDDGQIDEAVKLTPTRKARCGHISFNYFSCSRCKGSWNDEGSLSGLAVKLKNWNMETLSYAPKVKKAFIHHKPKPPKKSKIHGRLVPKGYYFCHKTQKYFVKHLRKHIGWSRTADGARAIYVEHVKKYWERVDTEQRAAATKVP